MTARRWRDGPRAEWIPAGAFWLQSPAEAYAAMTLATLYGGALFVEGDLATVSGDWANEPATISIAPDPDGPGVVAEIAGRTITLDWWTEPLAILAVGETTVLPEHDIFDYLEIPSGGREDFRDALIAQNIATEEREAAHQRAWHIRRPLLSGDPDMASPLTFRSDRLTVPGLVGGEEARRWGAPLDRPAEKQTRYGAVAYTRPWRPWGGRLDPLGYATPGLPQLAADVSSWGLTWGDSLTTAAVRYHDWSGLDPHRSWTGIDAGFSPHRTNMLVAGYPLLSLLACVALQTRPGTIDGEHLSYEVAPGRFFRAPILWRSSVSCAGWGQG